MHLCTHGLHPASHLSTCLFHVRVEGQWRFVKEPDQEAEAGKDPAGVGRGTAGAGIRDDTHAGRATQETRTASGAII